MVSLSVDKSTLVLINVHSICYVKHYTLYYVGECNFTIRLHKLLSCNDCKIDALKVTQLIMTCVTCEEAEQGEIQGHIMQEVHYFIPGLQTTCQDIIPITKGRCPLPRRHTLKS